MLKKFLIDRLKGNIAKVLELSEPSLSLVQFGSTNLKLVQNKMWFLEQFFDSHKRIKKIIIFWFMRFPISYEMSYAHLWDVKTYYEMSYSHLWTI